MWLLLTVSLLQAVQAAPPETIDLTIRQPCETKADNANEIVVCGRTGSSRYRLNEPLAQRQSDVPKAEVQLANGVTIAAETENSTSGSQPTNRIMARIKIRF